MSRTVYHVSHRRGFTLIELLVVVSIIALLISILLPSMKNARQQAQAVACGAQCKQTATAIITYQMENNGFVPPNAWSEYDWYVRKGDLWFYKLFPKYLGNPDILICPGDPFRNQFDFEAKHPSPSAPPHAVATVASCGYGLNYVFRHWGEPHSFNLERYAPRRPANTILFAEVGPDTALVKTDLTNTNILGKGVPWRDGGRLVWDDGARSWYAGPTWLTGRHAGKINMTSLDGTVHRVRTDKGLREGPQISDPRGLANDCTFCNLPTYGSEWGWNQEYHYIFSHAGLYWWTGRFPEYPN